MLVMLTGSVTKSVKITRLEILKSMCEKIVLALVQTESLVEVILNKNAARYHAYMTGKGILDV